MNKKEFEILNDKRRLTVAITRAKEKLILIGSSKALKKYKPIDNIMKSFKQNNSFYELMNLNEFIELEKI